MKHTALYLSMLAGLFMGTLPTVWATESAADTEEVAAKPKKKGKKGKKKQATIGPVGEALQNATFFTDIKPEPTATHYFFLKSASWCGPCKAIMPKIVEEYPKMKEAGVEVILYASEAEPQAKKYLEGYKAGFAGILPFNANSIPGVVFEGSAVPSMCLVDAEGNTVTTGHGRMVLQWRQLTNQPEDKGPGAVAQALEELKFFNGKPSKKAKYYIYLHSSATCAACKTFVPTIVKNYKKMKKEKVEIIFVSHDATPEAAKAYAKEERMKFAGIMDAEATKLPGYTQVSGMPSATIVDKHGTVIKSGHAALLNDWETFCK